MKMIKRILAALLCVLPILTLMPTKAEGNKVNLKGSASLTVSCQDKTTPLVGVEFDIYLAATLSENGVLTATKDFSNFNVNIADGIKSGMLASTLEGYVLRDQLIPTDTSSTEKNGCAYFPTAGKSLTPGLYLILAKIHTQNGYKYEFSPITVILSDTDSFPFFQDIDVIVNAKFNSEPEPSESVKITRKVLKVWNDDGYENQRPKRITVHLLRDNKIFDTVVLSADNNWRYTWKDLDNSSKWNVVENENKKYTASVSREGITFVITNTYIDEDKPDESLPEENTPPDKTTHPETTAPDTPDTPNHNNQLPQTGQLWWPVPVLVTVGLLFVIIGLIRRRSNIND